MTSPMLPSQVLDQAATIIERQGWTRDVFYGWHPILAPEKCKVCADGAINVAAGRHPEFAVDAFEHTTVPAIPGPSHDVEEWALAGPDAEAMEVIAAARAVFARHLRGLGYDQPLPDHELITKWNDEPERTQAEVVRELRAAAAAAREDGR